VASDDRSLDDERSTSDDVLAVVREVAARGWSLAGSGTQALAGGVEDALRAMVRRRVDRAMRPGAPAVDADALVDALDPRSGPALSPWIGAGAARLARTGRVAKVVGGRTPLGLAVRFGPAVHAAVTTSIRGIDAAAAHVVHRARAEGVEPDPERVHRVVVQALGGGGIDPHGEADHGRLLRGWLAAAGRRAVPFGDRISGLRGGRTPEAIAATLASVDVTRLGPR
jgi:hypothetical protein